MEIKFFFSLMGYPQIEELLFYENYIVSVFWIEDLFFFFGNMVSGQSTYLGLGLLLGTSRTSL